MKFKIRQKESKEKHIYKTIYLKRKQVQQIEALARRYQCSWNRVVISMLEEIIAQEKEQKSKTASCCENENRCGDSDANADENVGTFRR